MRSFSEIYSIASERKGGANRLEQLLDKPVPQAALANRDVGIWLEAMAKALFQAGFSWLLIEQKWPSFRTAFDGFDVATVAHYRDEDLDRLLSDKAIVRNGAKLSAVIENARFLLRVESNYGGASACLANWPPEKFSGLLEWLSIEGARLGGVTGQRVCRLVGKDGYVLSPDVCKRLVAESVIDKAPSSKRAMSAVQAAFNQWRDESGRTLTEVSQVLAMSID